METSAESGRNGPTSLQIRLLGPLRVLRDGVPVSLPSSRKVRALLAYLAVSPQGVSRTQLCELLWELPNDPRGELRWSLSKLRQVIDQPDRRRVGSSGDTLKLDLTDCAVDALAVSAAVQSGLPRLGLDRLQSLLALFEGEFLEGLDMDRSPSFHGWLVTQRRHMRNAQAALLEQLASAAPDDEALPYLERWLALSPFDRRIHEAFLQALARRGLIREGEEHLSAAALLFESEGLDIGPIRQVWRNARTKVENSSIETPGAAAIVAGAEETPAVPSPTAGRRASIAIMPFADPSGGGRAGGAGDGLAHDIITRLAKLRSLFVIAPGSIFALRERQMEPERAGRLLNVDYVVTGSLRLGEGRLMVSVELTESRTARIAWAETFKDKADASLEVFEEIGNRIVASIAQEIETIERNRAILRPPNSLDAWEAYHRGLWHMYKFSRQENAQAQQFFRTAVKLDPTFARAHAGLSFTHFQNAFQGWADRKSETQHAYAAAAQSLLVDDRDPAAHWSMGRALWLRMQHQPALEELETAVEISPNFALGHYTLAFVHSQAGDPHAAIEYSDHSRQLSPFDPLLFGMLGSRAMALMRLERFEEAAEWGEKAAARPNAHAHIRAIAAYALAMAGRTEAARPYLAGIHREFPDYKVDDFLTAMHLSPEGAKLYRAAARRLGT